MARDNTQKTFLIGAGTISAILLIIWICYWACSGKDEKRPAKKKKFVFDKEESELKAESGQWDEDEHGWEKYDERWGKRGKKKSK